MAQPPPWEYLIEEAPMSTRTEEIRTRFNELGANGWQLLFIGPYGDPSDSVRVYFMRPGPKVQEQEE